MTRTTGRDLKAERVRAGLTQEQVAQLLGVSRRRVTTVENSFTVTPAFAERMLEAIAMAERP